MTTECCSGECNQGRACPLRDMPATKRLHSRVWLTTLIVWVPVIAALLLSTKP